MIKDARRIGQVEIGPDSDEASVGRAGAAEAQTSVPVGAGRVAALMAAAAIHGTGCQ